MFRKRTYLRKKQAQLEALAYKIDAIQQQNGLAEDSKLNMIITELRAQFVKTKVLFTELCSARKTQFRRRKTDFKDALNHTLRLLEQTRFEKKRCCEKTGV